MSVEQLYKKFTDWYCPDSEKRYYWIFADVELSARAARPMKRAKRAIIVLGMSFLVFILPLIFKTGYEDMLIGTFTIVSLFPMLYVIGGYFVDRLLLDRVGVCK